MREKDIAARVAVARISGRIFSRLRKTIHTDGHHAPVKGPELVPA